jgi:hypothetical protein
VEACDCLPAGGYTDQDIQSVLATADAVVHAKVVSLATNREARIMILESFKGQPSVLRAQAGDPGGCGTFFRAGEEAIYLVYAGEVSLCGRLPVQSDLLRRLREHKR